MPDHEHLTAATALTKKEPTTGLRAFIQEIIAMGVIVAVGLLAFAIMALKTAVVDAVKVNSTLQSQLVSVTHSNALITQQALAHLEGREVTGEAKGFVVPPKD